MTELVIAAVAAPFGRDNPQDDCQWRLSCALASIDVAGMVARSRRAIAQVRDLRPAPSRPPEPLTA